jgi:prepilin-type N-terminal cleavage/methylation domain-containing protein
MYVSSARALRFSRVQRGFTLVELSIVLVIIGLLIGGVLVAQSMISSAKLQAQIKQFQQLDIAISNFQIRFGSLPGDSNLFPDEGDMDGRITSGIGGNGGAYPSFLGEVKFVYPQLQQGVGFLQDYTFDTSDSCGGDDICNFNSTSNINLLGAAINDNTAIAISWDEDILLCKNCYLLSDWFISNFEESNGTLSYSEAAGLDTKMDDSVSNTGNVRNEISANPYTDTNKLWVKILSIAGEENWK